MSDELNVVSLATCADPLQYASLRAEPDWQALGKRLGKDVGAVSKAIKELTAQQIGDYERDKRLMVAGHELGEGDIRVRARLTSARGVRCACV